MKYRRIMLNGQPWLMPEPRKYGWAPWAIAALVLALVVLKLFGG